MSEQIPHSHDEDDWHDEDEPERCDYCREPFTQPYEPVDCDGCGLVACCRCIRPWDDVMGDLCFGCQKEMAS